MRCPNCNCDVPEGSLFCPECGQKLEGVNGSQAENSGETYNDQQQDAEDVYGDQQRNKEDTYNDRSEDTEDSLWDQPQNSSDIYGTSPRNYGNPYGNQSQNQGGFYGNPSQNQNFGGSYGNQSRISAGPIRGSKMAGIHTGDSLSLRIMNRSEWQQGIILITACRVEEKTRIRSLS